MGGEIIPPRVLCPWRAHLLASIDLAALAIKPGSSEPQLTTTDGLRARSG